MSAIAECLPALSSDVTISPADPKGRQVVKHLRKLRYLQVGQEESFLLSHFDGKTSYDSVIESFQGKFGDSITRQDVKAFVAVAKKEGLLRTSDKAKRDKRDKTETDTLSFPRRCLLQARRQSPLYFRVSLFDPNRSLNWLEPKTKWIFSVETAAAAFVLGLVAIFITWASWSELAAQFATMWGWKTIFVAGSTIIVVSVCHEYGHGLACKRFGGEVREMGLLWIFFTPCFYCNVSDAWLVPSRWKRLLVSLAGTYVDVLIWIVAVFLWRVAAPGTWLSAATWIVVTTCGLRVAFNLNPLFRMDGYYAFADIAGVHNLRRRARARLMEFARWSFWGAPRPKPTEDGGLLLSYGILSWVFVVGVMAVLTFKLSTLLQPLMGLGGILVAGSFFYFIAKRYFKGSLGEDFMIMLRSKKLRVIFWLAAVVGVFMIPITDRAGGEFFVRPMVHWEVRAPVAGFLRDVSCEQGVEVSAGVAVARIEVPELASQIARKKLEIAESEAILRKLRCGPRPEAMIEQKARIDRATNWRDLAQSDLVKANEQLTSELDAFRFRIEQGDTDVKYRTTVWTQAKSLYDRGGLAGQQLLLLERQLQESRAVLKQIEAQKNARIAEGVLVARAELARRGKELADIVADMTLMEAGTRPEEIEVEEAKLRRLNEEMRRMYQLDKQQIVTCPVGGTVTTLRLNEKIGQFLELGSLICVVEDLSQMEAEISVSEHDAYILKPGQLVTLRPRSLPFSNIVGEVERIAPATISASSATVLAGAALSNPGRASLAVYCRVENEEKMLRTGMTGFGRVHAEKKRLGWYVLNKAIRLMRTELWW